jgi:hypothetical protein
MNTLEIIAKHRELHERWMQYLVWAIPFKDKEANARLELAKRKLTEFEEIEWSESDV